MLLILICSSFCRLPRCPPGRTAGVGLLSERRSGTRRPDPGHPAAHGAASARRGKRYTSGGRRRHARPTRNLDLHLNNALKPTHVMAEVDSDAPLPEVSKQMPQQISGSIRRTRRADYRRDPRRRGST